MTVDGNIDLDPSTSAFYSLCAGLQASIQQFSASALFIKENILGLKQDFLKSMRGQMSQFQLGSKG